MNQDYLIGKRGFWDVQETESQRYFWYELVYQSKKSRARVGRIHTPHGIIETPNFVPVGTNGVLKGVPSIYADSINIDMMFCNTYHLMVQPGLDVLEKAGGLHKFMKRDRPIITDSGGFQVFSLAYGGVAQELKSKGTKKTQNGIIKIREEGVWFRSYRDGSPLLLSPEKSIQAQKVIGADMIVSFDELPPYHMGQKKLRASLERTHRWEKRSLDEHKRNRNQQALYAVVHGGIDKDLRKLSAQYLSKLDFDGYGIGGSVGKDRHEMHEMLKFLMPLLPEDKPIHLLGIGDLPSIEDSVPLGIDTFDSSHPTKCARHGLLFTKNGFLKITKTSYAQVFRPIEDDCLCSTCQNYTVSYLRHLLKAHELAYFTLASIHNLYFMNNLMREYREKIVRDEI